MDPRIKSLPKDFTIKVRELEKENKLSVHALCKIYDVAPTPVKRWLNQVNKQLTTNNTPWEKLNDIEVLVKTIKQATFYEDIDLYKQSPVKFKQIVERNNINIDHLISQRDYLADKINEYALQGKGATEISRIMNIKHSTVISIAKSNKITFPSYAGTKSIYKIKDIEQFKKDAKVLHLRDLQRKYNIKGQWAVFNICNELGITHPKTLSNIWDEQHSELLDKKDQIIELNSTKNINDIKLILNIKSSKTKIYTFLNSVGYQIKIHGYNDSNGEREIRSFINQLGVRCESVKYSFDNKVYELDAYCPDYKIAFEYCGEYWHSTFYKDKMYHFNKYKWCKDQGIRLYTIWEHEWIQNRELLESMIKSRLNMSLKIGARECSVSSITNYEACLFHETNHIHRAVNSKYNIGLFYKGELVGVTSFSKSRFQRESEFEITRMCFKQGTNILGGASKMLKHFRKQHQGCISTYADLRYGDGAVYKALGFEYRGTTKPNYWYFNTKTQILYNRMNFQKKKVLKMFPEADPSLSEQTIMTDNDYLILYDCGSNRYFLE